MSANILTKGGSSAEAGEKRRIGGKTYICAYRASALAIGVPVIITNTAAAVDTAGYTPVAVVPGTLATHNAYCGVTNKTISSAGWYWFQIQGLANVYVLGASSVVVGGVLSLTAAGTNLVATNSTGVETTATCAISQVAYTTASAALKSVFLTGGPVQVP